MKLSLKIRLLRHSAGLDQHQAAKMMKISVADYSRIESGIVKPENDLFEDLLVLFALPEN